MSTHGTIKFTDKRGRVLLSIYNHYDSYYSGLGQVIYDFFSNKKNYGNGFEDTVLLFLCHIKEGKPYRIYATDQDDYQEYNYEIYETEKGLQFTVTKTIFTLEKDYTDPKLKHEDKLIRGSLEQFKKLLDTE